MTQIQFEITTVIDDNIKAEGWWKYTTSDPWAVTLQLGQVEWLFARELLLYGLSEPVGDGDVQIMPDTGGNPVMLNVRLESPAGVARVAVARDTVMTLLDAVYTLVPDGREAESIDWDREWSRLADGPTAA